MRKGDQYFRYVYWSDEDQLYVGLCPDLFYGGIHGTDREKVHAELSEAIVEAVTKYEHEGKPLPAVNTPPLAAAVAA